jgi:hypothetical protein
MAARALVSRRAGDCDDSDLAFLPKAFTLEERMVFYRRRNRTAALAVRSNPNLRLQRPPSGGLFVGIPDISNPCRARMGFWEVRGMRSLSLLIFVLVVLWMGDLFLFKGRHANELRVTVERMSHNLRYEIRRWIP